MSPLPEPRPDRGATFFALLGADLIPSTHGGFVLLELNDRPAIGGGSMHGIDSSVYHDLCLDLTRLVALPAIDISLSIDTVRSDRSWSQGESTSTVSIPPEPGPYGMEPPRRVSELPSPGSSRDAALSRGRAPEGGWWEHLR